MFRILQHAGKRPEFDRTSCLTVLHTLSTNLSVDHALWSRATTTIKMVTIERSSEDLTFSSNSFLFSTSRFPPLVSRGRNTSYTSDWNFSTSSRTFAFVISIIHLIMQAAKSGSVSEFRGKPSFSDTVSIYLNKYSRKHKTSLIHTWISWWLLELLDQLVVGNSIP